MSATANPAQSIEQLLQVHQAGRGRVAGAKAGRRARLDRVRGIGYGMTAEQQAKLFQEFSQTAVLAKDLANDK
jgi:hypothetical protein